MKCQNCGSELRNGLSFCPKCGNLVSSNNHEVTPSQRNQLIQPKNKISVWKIILGIIFFPVALTIIIAKNKKMKLITKIVLIVILWLFVLAVGVSDNSENDVSHDNPSYNGNMEGNFNEEDFVDSSTDKQPSEESTVYAADDVVNRFISEFNTYSIYEISDISKGNIRTKYFGYANGRYLEMINANGAAAKAFCLKINGGQEEADKQSMYEVFKEAVKILDPSITEEMVNAALTEFDTKDVLIEDYMIGDNICVTYVPTKELSYGKNSCRIDIYASNYK